MRITQNWTPDTHPDLTFVQEKDADGNIIGCVAVIKKLPDGSEEFHVNADDFFERLNDNQKKSYGHLEEKKIINQDVPGMHIEAEQINSFKNSVIIPKLLEALPASEKITLEDGSFAFKNYPEFFVQDGELKADFSSLKAGKAAALAVMSANKRGK